MIIPVVALSQRVNDGVLDLQNAKFDKAYLVAGEWEFYWGELLSPDDLKDRIPSNLNFIKVNGDWNNYLFNGNKVKSNGYGTYKLKIIAPQGGYTIQFHQVLTAYKVWINGNLKVEVGKVDTNKQNSKPKLLINEINFLSEQDTIEIIVQVSNFYHGAGGLQEKIFFGNTNDIQTRTTKHLLLTFLAIGAELIFALYFFFLFFFRQKDLAYIFLSIAILTFISFGLVNGEMILIRYLPSISWDWAKKIDFFSNYGRLFFFGFFMWFSFKEYNIISKKIISIIIVLSGIYSLIVLFTPSYIFSQTLLSFIGWGYLSFMYFLYVTINGLFKKVPYVMFSFLGMLALNISLVNDVLHNLNIVNTMYSANYGLLVLFIGNSLMISLKYTKTSTRVTKLDNKYKKYAEIQSKLLKTKSFDLKSALYVLNESLGLEKIELLLKDKVLLCECIKTDEEIHCGYLERNFSYSISDEDIELVEKKLSIVNKNGSVILPILNSDGLKAILYITFLEKNNFKEKIEILELLVSPISTIINNYSYYWNLELLNNNLEEIIETRTKLAYKQKNELEEKNIDLDEKIEELNISSSIVKDLNTEIKNQSDEINKKNKQLDILRKQTALQKNILEEKQHNIHSSINYAKKIQQAFLSSVQEFPIDEKFVLNIPKEIVSGDFYASIVFDNLWLLGIIDTTGRNVSATFLTFFIESILAEIIERKPELIVNPAKLIEEMRLKYHAHISNDKNIEIDDSFDIGLCSIELETGKMKFAAANQNLLVVRKKEPIVLKGDNYTIGGYYTNFEDKFTTQQLDLKPEDKIYLYTDGYRKQMGQKNRVKFGGQNFISLLTQISPYNPQKQKEILSEKYLEWKGSVKQVDDVLVIGAKFTKQNFT